MSEVTTAVARVLEEDTPCRRCGYNLRGLASTGLCPECGTAIVLSLVGNLLKRADPDWLDRVRLGIAVKLWNLTLAVLAGFAGIVAGMTGVGFPRVQGAALVIVSLAFSALGLWATFLITSQEPRIALQEDPITLRKALRASAAAAFVGSALSYAKPDGTWGIVVQVVGALLGLAGMFVAWGELLYFRRFAERIPDPKLAKSTTLLMWVGPITGGVAIALGLAVALIGGLALRAGTAGATGSSTGMAVGLGACFFLLFGLCLFLWYVRLLTKYRKAFQQAVAESRASAILQPEA